MEAPKTPTGSARGAASKSNGNLLLISQARQMSPALNTAALFRQLKSNNDTPLSTAANTRYLFTSPPFTARTLSRDMHDLNNELFSSSTHSRSNVLYRNSKHRDANNAACKSASTLTRTTTQGHKPKPNLNTTKAAGQTV